MDSNHDEPHVCITQKSKTRGTKRNRYVKRSSRLSYGKQCLPTGFEPATSRSHGEVTHFLHHPNICIYLQNVVSNVNEIR